MREAAGQDDHVGAAQVRLLVPHELGVVPEHVLRGVVGVVIAVRAGEDDDGEFHADLYAAWLQAGLAAGIGQSEAE